MGVLLEIANNVPNVKKNGAVEKSLLFGRNLVLNHVTVRPLQYLVFLAILVSLLRLAFLKTNSLMKFQMRVVTALMKAVMVFTKYTERTLQMQKVYFLTLRIVLLVQKLQMVYVC